MRRVAGYVSKYVGKAYEDASSGRHRYECAQGFQPISLELTAPRPDAFAGLAAMQCFDGEAPITAWSSSSAEMWTGPPVEVWQWELREEVTAHA
jgi:hypothetical protein